MNSFCAWYSFRMSFCSVPPSRARSTPPRSAFATYIANTIAAGPLIVIDVVTVPRSMPAVEVFDVGERVDRDAALADLAERERVVGVAAHQRRQVERGRQAVATRVRAVRGSDGSCRSRCRTPRTSASSTASTGTSTRTGRACTGTGRGTRRRRARRPARPGRPTSWRSRRHVWVRRRRQPYHRSRGFGLFMPPVKHAPARRRTAVASSSTGTNFAGSLATTKWSPSTT